MNFNIVMFAKISLLITAIAAHVAFAEESPGPRFGHELVYDEKSGVTILFGGFGEDGVPLGDTWGWDGADWRLLTTTGPSPRKWPAAAYDAKRNVVVLFGGREGVGRSGSSLSDTWVWNGNEWTKVEAVGPSGRDHHRMVFDHERERIVLFGGWDGEKVVGDTWEWDGTAWQLASLSGPAPRAPFGMAWSEPDRQIILMGGQNLGDTFSDTWSWDGTTWSHKVEDGPGARTFHAMTTTAKDFGVLVFGGRVGTEYLRDLWRRNGGEWTLISSDGPLRRGIHAAVYDPLREQLLIYGAGDLTDAGWQLESSTWTWSRSEGWREHRASTSE